MLWRQLLPEKSFGHRASNKKSNGKLDSGGVGWIICWELSMRMTEHGIAHAKNSWNSKEYVQYISVYWIYLNLAFLDMVDFWWVWMSVGARPAIQLPVGWLYWFTLLQSLLWTDSWDGCNLAALFKHDKQETLELLRFMSEQSISSLTLGFPILTKKPEELSGSTLIVVRFFLNFHCGQNKEICHCDGFAIKDWCRNLDGLVSGEAMSKPSTSTVCGTAGDSCALPEIEVLTNISKSPRWSSILLSPADTLQIWAPHPLCFLNREAACLADSP